MQIPTVTEADLLQYHASHYGFPFLHAQLRLGTHSVSVTEPQHSPGEADQAPEADDDDDDDDDDGLGYYRDGTKRTLTRLQVAMFRHTEIENVLREQRLRMQTAEELDGDTPPPPPPRVRSTAREREGGGGSGRLERDEDEDEVEEREYARFLAAERREFEVAAAQKRNGERGGYEYGRDKSDRTISTRRRVREMDEMGAGGGADVLMYDDGPAEGGEKKGEEEVKHATTEERKGAEGRKIWFPMIG